MEYYSFIIDGQKVGYYEKETKDGVFYQNALFEMGGEQMENAFWVKLQGDTIVAYRFDDTGWRELANFPENSYPTSAFELLAQRLKDGEALEYDQINEGKGTVTGKARMERKGTKVQETVNGKAGRHLVLDERGLVVAYGWGGSAKSVKVGNKAEAIKDTAFAK